MKRDYRIDFLRVVAILAVLAIHCFGGKGSFATYINGLCRFSVPMFVMLSAICCAPKLIGITSLSAFYKPRFMRVGIPLLSFSLLYMLENVMAGDTVTNVVKSFILGTPSYHLWFGFMIFGVYVFIPFMAQLAAQINHVLLLVVSCFVILMTWYVGSGGLYSILPFTAYALIGLLLLPVSSRLSETPKCIRLLVGVSCLSIYAVCGIIAGYIGGCSALSYTSICSLIGSVFLTVAVLTLLPQTASEKTEQVFAVLSDYTFGIYLFHVIAIRGILRVVPSLAEARLSAAAVLWTAVVIFSFAVTYVASKIPLLRVIFGVKAKKEIPR